MNPGLFLKKPLKTNFKINYRMDVIKIKQLWYWWIANKWNFSIQYDELNQVIPVNPLIKKLAAVEVQLLTLERFGCTKEGKIKPLTWLICLEKLISDSFYYKTPVYLVNFSNNAHYGHFIKYINLLNVIKQTELPSKYLYILINNIEYGHKGNKRLTLYTKTYRTG